ncbi:H/ACA ribonucleoprotein complex non-core subunit NAF1 [Setaria italica]|nr:H/ACA ribonucleoprotein complex non-core subunit NAF1 [Setaria italica]
MAPVLLHALLLASAAAAAAMNNATGDGSSNTTKSRILCNGAECEPPGKTLPIYGYPPPAPSLPSAPPSPPSSSGSQTPCPPVAVVCCGGAGMPQQPNYYGPPTGGYVPYYNASASSPALLAPITLVGYYVMVACIFLLWLVV